MDCLARLVWIDESRFSWQTGALAQPCHEHLFHAPLHRAEKHKTWWETHRTNCFRVQIHPRVDVCHHFSVYQSFVQCGPEVNNAKAYLNHVASACSQVSWMNSRLLQYCSIYILRLGLFSSPSCFTVAGFGPPERINGNAEQHHIQSSWLREMDAFCFLPLPCKLYSLDLKAVSPSNWGSALCS